MSQQILEMVEKSSLKAEVPDFSIGDLVDVHTKILEGDKERIQIFSGVVIARSGSGTEHGSVQVRGGRARTEQGPRGQSGALHSDR